MLIRAEVAGADYAPEVDKRLREYRRTVNMPGFRPGMVPKGIIDRMYRKGTVAEQSYRIASEGVFKYLEDNKIDFMGDVMPSDEQGQLDFDGESEYEFVFEIGIAPKVEYVPGEGDKLTYHRIKVSNEMRESYRSNFLNRFGRLEDVDEVTSDEAVEATLDNGALRVEEAYIGLVSLDEEGRKPFIGKRVGDTMAVDVNGIYKSPAQAASILGVGEDELASIDPKFTATITKIRRFAMPDIDAEFLGTAFPDGSVADEAGFEKYIDEKVQADLDRESDYLFAAHLRDHLIEKAALELPDEFLKRWLHAANEGKFTAEEIENDFAGFARLMAWNLIQKHFIKKFGLEVTQEDMLGEAKSIARMQFAQYGMASVPDDTLEGYAKSILSNRDEAQKIYDRVREEKVIGAIKPLIKTVVKNVTVEEFQKAAATE